MQTNPNVRRDLVASAVTTTLGVCESVARATGDYLGKALTQPAAPAHAALDVLTWWATALHRERPAWATPHEIVHEGPLARLRDFSTASAADDDVAVLVLPPQAGHDSCIVDFQPAQSQMRTAQQAGVTRLFALDWKGATSATKNATIEDYLDVVGDAVERIGGRAHLVGDCQGGWLAVVYAALHPSTVASLTIAGAPVDFHAGEPLIYDWMRALTPADDLAFYRAVVKANDGILPGEFQLGGFQLLQLDKELDRQLQLLAHIDDPAHVDRYRTFETWFQHTQPISGAFYLWIVEHLFVRNELIAGKLRVGGRRVDLGWITCPVHLMAGATDHITPPAQVWALADYVGTDADRIVRHETAGGHLGLFMGRDTLETRWAPLFAEIAASTD